MFSSQQAAENLIAELQGRGLTRSEAITAAQLLVEHLADPQPPTVTIRMPAAWSPTRRDTMGQLLQRIVDVASAAEAWPAPAAEASEPERRPVVEQPEEVLATLPTGEPVVLTFNPETGAPESVEVRVGEVLVGFCLDMEARGFRPVYVDGDDLTVTDAEARRAAMTVALDTVVRLGRDVDAGRR